MLLLCAVLLPIAVAGISNEYRIRQERVAEVHAEALRTAQLVNADMESVMQGTRALLVAISANPTIRDLDKAHCAEQLTELSAKFDRYDSILLTDWNGTIICSSGSQKPGSKIGDRRYIARAREAQDFTVGHFRRTQDGNLPVLPLAYPFRDAGGQWRGILVATLDLKWLSQHITKIPKIGTAIVGVADDDGVLLARSVEPDRFIGKPLPPDVMPPVHAVAPGTTEAIGVDGVFRIVGYVPSVMEPKGLFVGVGFDRAAAMHDADIETSVESLCIVGAILLALFGGWIGSGRFALLQERMVARTAELEAEKERRAEVEAVLVQSQKLEAVGQLTAGLAHDFNNLLSVVLGNIELARVRLPGEEEEIDKLLIRATRAADRGSGLTRQLLAFARNQKMSIEPADANQLVEGVLDLLERSAGPSVRIRLDLGAGLAPVLVDRGQLEVALLNLVLNARDAMALGGSITISTRNTEAGVLPADLAAGDYVQIRVRDTGPGMPREVRERAFEPFFTTKEVGKGSGLGLAQVFGIARQSGGTVSLDSEPGQGTTVTIFLPRSTVPVPVAVAEPGYASYHGELSHMRVLLVDDDPDVRSTMANLLDSLDVDVIEVDSGPAALDHLARDTRFNVLITDFAMPEMNGAILAERATALVPRLKVLMVTGFAIGADEESFPWPVLKKPFKSIEMETALRDLADAPNIVRLPPGRGASAGR
jgi:signal transduction histidine kinase